jgi:hypothetical protein
VVYGTSSLTGGFSRDEVSQKYEGEFTKVVQQSKVDDTMLK